MSGPISLLVCHWLVLGPIKSWSSVNCPQLHSDFTRLHQLYWVWPVKHKPRGSVCACAHAWHYFFIFFCRSRNFCRLSTGISSKLIPCPVALRDRNRDSVMCLIVKSISLCQAMPIMKTQLLNLIGLLCCLTWVSVMCWDQSTWQFVVQLPWFTAVYLFTCPCERLCLKLAWELETVIVK